MAQIKSKVFNLTFETKTFESVEDGNSVNIITHEALEGIIHDQLPANVEVRYDFTVVASDISHCVVQCVMSSVAPKRRIVAIGETVPDTLETDISKQYPCTMACNRAFDRAAIRFLGLEGKVLSNLEAPAYNGADDGTTNVDLSDVPDETPAEAAMRPQGVAESGEKAKQASTPSGQKKPVQGVQKPQAANPAAQPAQKADMPEDVKAAASVVLAFGKYKHDNLTLAQIGETEAGRNYINWMLTKATNLPAEYRRAATLYYSYLTGSAGGK